MWICTSITFAMYLYADFIDGSNVAIDSTRVRQTFVYHRGQKIASSLVMSARLPFITSHAID